MKFIRRYEQLQLRLNYGSMDWIECETIKTLSIEYLSEAKGDPTRTIQHSIDIRKRQKQLEKMLLTKYPAETFSGIL